MIEFKTYSETRLIDHVNLVLEVIQDWKWKPWYPNKEQIKNIYSREGFTADTRHYVYDGNQLVGFLSSAVEDVVDGVQFGSFHIPFILKEYVNIEEKLFKKTIDTLKDRGVQAIRTTTMPGWGPIPNMLKKLGFGEKKLLAERTIFSAKDLADPEFTKPEYFIDLDPSKDKEEFVEAAHVLGNVPKEELERTYDYFIENEMIYAGVVAKIDEEIIGYGLLYEGAKYEEDKVKRAFLSRIPIKEGKEFIFKYVFQYLVNQANELNIDLIWHQKGEKADLELYSEFDIKFEPFYQLILRLS